VRLYGWVWRRAVVGIFILSQALPVYAWSAAMSLGTARRGHAVQLTFNEGETWLPLGGWTLPVIQGSQIRSTTGSAVVELIDGSRIHVLPFNTVRFQEADGTIEVSLLHGRLTFQLPANSRIEILTLSARLEPVRQEAMVGEVFLDGEGVVGLKMTRGVRHVQVHPGFTADLTRPFPNKLVWMAMAAILEESRSDTTPLFNVNGKYLGYLSEIGSPSSD
jgi:hypothetical protein